MVRKGMKGEKRNRKENRREGEKGTEVAKDQKDSVISGIVFVSASWQILH